MVRLLLVMIPVIAFADCRTENPDYCKNFPGTMGCPGEPMNGGTCSINTDCTTFGFPICDTTIKLCVQCTDEHNPCVNPVPACVNNTCQMCTSHSQCSSRACLPDGTCADAAQVAYVRPGGSGTACTDSTPCATLTDGLNAGKATVKVEGNIIDSDVATATISVTILADTGSQVTRSSPGTILVVSTDQADVHISDLRITGGMGAKGDIAVSVSGGSTPKLALLRVQVDNNVGIGISVTAGTLTVTQSTITGNGVQGIWAMNSTLTATQCTISNNSAQGILAMNSTLTATQNTITGNSAEGISATNSTLTATQCTISSNSAIGISTMDTALNVSRSTVSGNAGGGISITSGSFDITNNFITSNGASTTFGGVIINMTNVGTQRFEFNTVTDNNALAGKATGVFCAGTATPIILSNNIVFDNVTGSNRTQIGGLNCNWTYSNIGDSNSTNTTTDPQGNKDTDPLFTDIVGNNYHLKSGSPVRDAADPAATLNVDFDGDTRPQGNRSDMGADEIVSSP
jgi:hypothetical protein